MVVEDVEGAKEAEEVEDSEAAESCLARKVASFGMMAHRHYIPRRI
jgi:hypothetical protein